MCTTCPECNALMDTSGQVPGKVVRCACGALLYVTAERTLETVPPDRIRPRQQMTLWGQSEQLRDRLLAEIDRLQPYQLQALAGQLHRMSEACSAELARRSCQ